MLPLHDNDAFRRLPGLYRRWELARLLKPGEAYQIEDAGSTIEGVDLVAVYESVAQKDAVLAGGSDHDC